MKAQLESTSKIVTLNGIPARVWEGTTEGGARIVAFITRVTPMDDDPGEFERELDQQRPPSPDVEAFPLRMIL